MAKKSKKNETIYCVFCGVENVITDTKCVKCKKDLHPKDERFKEFLYRHIKDDFKGKVEDNIFSYLKNFIISHLYGTAMTISVLFTAVAIIISPKSSYKVVSSLNEINQAKSNSKEIVATIYTYDDSCSEEFPEELRDVPFTAAGYIVSGNRRTIIEIKLEKGESITDWCNKNNSDHIICEVPLYVYDSKIEVQAKKHRDTFHAYADWYHKNGTSDEDEYIRRSDEVDISGYELLLEHGLDKYNKEKAVNKSIELVIPEVGCEY